MFKSDEDEFHLKWQDLKWRRKNIEKDMESTQEDIVYMNEKLHKNLEKYTAEVQELERGLDTARIIEHTAQNRFEKLDKERIELEKYFAKKEEGTTITFH